MTNHFTETSHESSQLHKGSHTFQDSHMSPPDFLTRAFQYVHKLSIEYGGTLMNSNFVYSGILSDAFTTRKIVTTTSIAL